MLLCQFLTEVFKHVTVCDTDRGAGVSQKYRKKVTSFECPLRASDGGASKIFGIGIHGLEMAREALLSCGTQESPESFEI